MKHELRFRQIHLDFHTSGLIPNVGRDFDPEAFAAMLEAAHVDSVTCFARCHHGWLYYDSKAMPDCVHPHLKNRNLLREQIEACHRHNIKVPVYTTVQWDDKVAKEHYDWPVLNEFGAPFKQLPFEPGFYRNICLNSPYMDYLKRQIRDMFDCLGELDGVFLDILNIRPCACPRCVAEMTAEGLDTSDESVRYEFAQRVLDRFKRDMTAFIHEIQPDCPVFYNAGFISTRHRACIDAFTHLEIESLPGGVWDYDHFPATARYARTLGLDFMGMTGKFHTDWGDFGSYRNQAALEYECFKSIAYCGKCSIGDQLHPFGALAPATYDLIGAVYGQVETKEPWCRGAKPVVEAAVMIPEEFRNAGTPLVTTELTGAVKLMTALNLQFNAVDSTEDFSKYRLLVLPDGIPVDAALEDKLCRYLQQGGNLIASHRAGLRADGSGFCDFMPVIDEGEAPFSPDYLVASGDLGAGLKSDAEYVMYDCARKVAAKPDAEELLGVNAPFFNRTWQHFCSHRQTPSCEEYSYPAVVRRDGIIYFAHPIFSTYDEYGCHWLQTLLSNAVNLLLGETLLRHDGPGTLEPVLNDQPGEHRMVLHALHYIPQRKSKKLDIIEDVIPLYHIHATLSNPEHHIRAARLVPENLELSLNVTESGISFEIPEIRGHQMIELLY